MPEHHSLWDTIRNFFPPIHPDGHKFVAIAALVTLVLFWLWSPLGWLGLLATLFVGYFFRDPARVVPQDDALVLAPADGRVSAIGEAVPPEELAMGDDPMMRISIFLSVMDVHINRAPVTGTLEKIVYVPGLFLNAELDKASEDNERKGYVIQREDGQKIAMVQIAGLVARRIVSFVAEGDKIAAGERFGLIRFGSRLDVYVPKTAGILVAVGQLAVGGETPLADLTAEGLRREGRTI